MHISKQNNFDLVRFILALIVMLVHLSELTKIEYFNPIFKYLSSSLAVECFFIISGFLICMSYESSKSINQYFLKRGMRILPGYFFAVITTGLLGFLISTLSIDQYFQSVYFYKYLFYNLIFMNFMQPWLPGVFADNHIQVINGSLWTLKIEIMFYILLPVILKFLSRSYFLLRSLFIYISSFLYVNICKYLVYDYGGVMNELSRQLPGQLMFFIVGVALFKNIAFFKKHQNLLLLISLIVILNKNKFYFEFFYPVSLGIVLLYLSLSFRYLGDFGKYGDFSYGIYIYHFPIIQTLILANIFFQPLTGLMVAFFSVLFVSILSWKYIEKPFLMRIK